jgi:hypothetical protein
MQSLRAMSTQTIELGTAQPWEPPPPPPRHRAMPRWLAPALAVVLLLLASVGDMPSGTPYAPLMTVNEIGVALFVGGDTMYEVPTDRNQTQRVRAYDLRTGRMNWERHFGLDHAEWRAVDDVLFQTVARTEEDERYLPAALRALDPATGRMLWERPNVEMIAALDNLVVLIEWLPSPQDSVIVPPPPDGPSRPHKVYVVEPRTGRVVRTYTFNNMWTFARSSADWGLLSYLETKMERIRVAELAPTGELRITDLGSGETTVPMRLPAATAIDYLDLLDDVVSVRVGNEVVSYDVGTGELLWRMPIPENGPHDYMCGRDLLCLTDYRDNGQMSVRVTRRSTGQVIVERSNAMIIGLLGDRILIQEDFRSAVRDTTVVDLSGRRPPRNLAPWLSVRPLDDRRVIAAAHVLGQSTATVAVLDVDTMQGVVLGQGRDWFVPPECRRSSDYVICTSGADQAVWRLPAEFRTRRQ